MQIVLCSSKLEGSCLLLLSLYTLTGGERTRGPVSLSAPLPISASAASPGATVLPAGALVPICTEATLAGCCPFVRTAGRVGRSLGGGGGRLTTSPWPRPLDSGCVPSTGSMRTPYASFEFMFALALWFTFTVSVPASAQSDHNYH